MTSELLEEDLQGVQGPLLISSKTRPQSAARAIFRLITVDHVWPDVRAIGHGAVGQAVKALAIARGLLAAQAIDMAVLPGFTNVESDSGEEISAIVFKLIER